MADIVVTALHASFGSKLTIKKTPNDVKWQALQVGYLGFSKFFTQKFQQQKIDTKIQNFQKT